MMTVDTINIPKKWQNWGRIRSAVRLNLLDGRILIYDLERTFIIEIPKVLHKAVSYLPKLDFSANFLREWLLNKDLLTRIAPPNWDGMEKLSLPKLTDVSLDISGNCNMNCSYCFERSLLSRKGRMNRIMLSETLDFIFENAIGVNNLSLHLGSGEPLLEFDLLRELVDSAMERAERLGIRVGFELTTNATLISYKIAEFLVMHPINVRISCDGPSPIHNQYRPMANGETSYESVIRGVKLLLSIMPERVTVNSVICSGTRLILIWNWSKDLGIKHLHVIKVGSDPMKSFGMQVEELSEYENDLNTICEDIYIDLISNHCPIDFQPISKVIRRLMLPAPITRFCGAGGSYLGIATDGFVYPCFRYLGLRKYRFGDVKRGINEGMRINFRNKEAATVDNRPLCQLCWARYICGGGCYADSVVFGPDPRTPQIGQCLYWKAEIAHGIRFYDKLRNINPQYCLSMFGNNEELVLENYTDNLLEFAKQRKSF